MRQRRREGKPRPLASLAELDASGVHDVHMYNALLASMREVGFSETDISGIHVVLIAVLSIGNVDFAVQEGSAEMTATISDMESIDRASGLMGVSSQDLMAALLTNVITTAGETFVRQNALVQALDARDALGKALYGRLFSWLVSRINRELYDGPLTHPTRSIAILDIFGFENFDTNSFEQLCINVANEQLQFYFNEYIFTWEVDEYKREGIDVESITFASNKPTLDLLLGRPLGVLTLMDEESKFARATDQSLLLKLQQNLRTSPCFSSPKSTKEMCFGVRHYAGVVSYNVQDFLEKNRDSLHSNMTACMLTSSCRLIRELFAAAVTSTGSIREKPAAGPTFRGYTEHKADGKLQGFHRKSGRPSTRQSGLSRMASRMFSRKRLVKSARKTKAVALSLGVIFRESLADLMTKISSAAPFFVRCVKPNRQHVPDKFVHEVVLPQLRYTGVLETARIRASGYATRLSFADFVQRYRAVAFEYQQQLPEDKVACTTILKTVRTVLCEQSGQKRKESRKAKMTSNCNPCFPCLLTLLCKANVGHWQLGKTKVFLHFATAAHMNALYDKIVMSATVLASAVRCWLARRELVRRRQVALQQQQREEAERREIERQERERIEAEAQLAAAQEAATRLRVAEEEEERRRQEEETPKLRAQPEIKDQSSAVVFAMSEHEMEKRAYLALDYVDMELYEELDLMLPVEDPLPGTEDLNRYNNILPTKETMVS